MITDRAKLIIGCVYLGRRIAARWGVRGEGVFATTRSPERAVEWRSLGLEPVVCDIMNPSSLHSLPPVDTIVHCVGLDRTAGMSMRTVYVDGLRNVLDALTRPPRQFIYVSSTSVYGQTEGEEVDETAATEPQEESGKIVLEAERLLRDRLPSAVVFRFAGIYGPGRLMRGAAIRAGDPIVGDAEKWLNLIHVEDGAAAVDAAERAAPGSLYNVSDGVPVRRRVFYTKLAELLEAPTPRFVRPDPNAPIPPHERGQRRIVSRRLREELGVSFRYASFADGLRASIGDAAAP